MNASWIMSVGSTRPASRRSSRSEIKRSNRSRCSSNARASSARAASCNPSNVPAASHGRFAAVRVFITIPFEFPKHFDRLPITSICECRRDDKFEAGQPFDEILAHYALRSLFSALQAFCRVLASGAGSRINPSAAMGRIRTFRIHERTQ